MVDRPPVKHVGTLPEGNLNGYAVLYEHLLDVEGAEGYFLARVRRTAAKHVDKTGVDEVHVQIVELEPLVNGKMPTDYDHAGEALQAIRGDRTGAAMIPEQDAADYARLAELRRQIEAYRVRESMTVTALGQAVLDTIPGAEAGWRDDPRILTEFLQHVDELDEDALESAELLDEPVENQSLERAGEDDPGNVVPGPGFTG